MSVTRGLNTEQTYFSEAADALAAYLGNSALLPDPYPVFKGVRDSEPVHWSEAGTWVVLGHPEGREALRHSALSRQESGERFADRLGRRQGADALTVETWLANMFNLDGVEHSRVRALVAHAFTPKAIRRWEHVIAETVEDLFVGLAERDSFDLLHDFSYPIPTRVICTMVGVPYEDHDLFESWTSRWNDSCVSDPRADMSDMSLAPLTEFFDYLRELVADRRHRALDSDDLVSLLVHAEESGDLLSEPELIAALWLLIGAGHETTTHLITNAALALLRNPDQFDLLRADRSLAATAVEEALRYDGPARTQPRLATADITIGDQAVRRGQSVQVLVGAANHDPRVFTDPDRLDITRQDNPHIGFGFGAHFCIGVHVARLEARYAIQAVARMGQLEIDGDLAWRPGQIRGVMELPVHRTR